MKKNYSVILIVILSLLTGYAESATWEKLYVKRSTDCFRSVRELSSGGYILAGYTADFAASDTDGLVMRLNSNGDLLWSFVYDGPSSKEDLFYKAVPTSDGGFILCGYSKSFGSGENAIFAKLSSSGNLQWIKNWGGNGIEHAQDIVQLSDGKYVACGYSTTSPARYYDAFIIKLDGSGNTLWTKLYGTTAYDDANTLIKLPDDGFLFGGQSNNNLYLIRTDQNGDSLWTKTWGTSGIDNIEYVINAQGGSGFIVAGTTDGAGSGGEDAYIVMTDSGGVQQWAKTIGGSDNDGLHRIEQTSDGGYFGVGTSSEGPWPDPNIWLLKMDGSGNKQWETFYGGDHHDHGYNGQPTSDGGYIAVGHTHSFIDDENVEDAMVIKTNSSGNVTTEVTWTSVTDLLTPLTGGCGTDNTEIKIEVSNYGIETVSSIPVTIEITGAINQTISQTFTTTIAQNATKTLTFTTHIDMSGGGTFNFHCYTTSPHDVYPAHNYFDKSVVALVTPSPPGVTNGSHCGPSTVTISASSPDQIKWYSASTGGSSLSTGSSFTTPFLTSSTTYYAQAGTTCPSTRVATNATITTGIAAPTVTDGSRCGSGTVVLAANSATSEKWYSNSTSMTVLFTGASYTTPSLSSTSTYYVASDNGTCTSLRVPVDAVINDPPNDPSVTPGTTCGTGTVVLSATASDPIHWYTSSSGGSQVGTGNTYTTPSISSTTTYYAQVDDGTCLSNRVPVIATIASIPAAPVTNPGERCGMGTVNLTATSANTIKWYAVPTGGSSLASGTTFTTPSLSATTSYYALSDNGSCKSARIAAIATINPLAASPVVTPAERCGDGSVTLSATAPDPITWYDAMTGGTQVGTGNSFNTPSLTSTTVYFAQSFNGTCPSDPIAVAAVINALPTVSIGPDTIWSSTSTFTLDAGSGFASYSWTPGDPGQTYTAFVSGTYCVTVTDANNCTANDCVYLELPLGVEDEKSVSSFSHYPEPTNGLVTISMNGNHSAYNLSVIDITGKIVFFTEKIHDRQSFDFTSLPQGVYILRLNDGKNSLAQRMIIQ